MAKFFCWDSLNERKEDGGYVEDADDAIDAAEVYAETHLWGYDGEADTYLVRVESESGKSQLFRVVAEYEVNFYASECAAD
jgi:hypothetical protein